MPNAPTHAIAAVVSGGALAIYRARDQIPSHRALEGLGGALGGLVGGRAPDSSFVDPASLGPNHRRFGHSWTVLVGGVYLADAVITAWERFCRDQADAAAHRLATDSALSSIGRVALIFAECMWRLAAGAMAGFIAGYTSHLVLDAFTARSLPVLGLDLEKRAVVSVTPPIVRKAPRPRRSIPVRKRGISAQTAARGSTANAPVSSPSARAA